MSTTHDIVAVERSPGGELAALAAPHPVVEASLAQAVAQRWMTVLVVTLTAAAASLAAIVLLLRPEYEVGSLVHVAPVVRPILAGDMDTDISRNYTSYMATQRGVILSPDLIAAAMEAPEVRAASPLDMPGDPVRSVLSMLRVERLGNTELLRLSLVGQQPQTLATILNSIVRTYLRRHDDERRSSDEQALASLRAEQTELETKLKMKGEQVRQLAADSGLAGPNDPGHTNEVTVATYQGMLTEARKTRAVADGRLNAIREQTQAGADARITLPGFEEFVGRDATLLSLKTQLRDTELSALTDKNYGRGPGHPDVQSRPQLIAALKDQIQAREDELRDIFVAVEMRRLEAEMHSAAITEKVVQEELQRAQAERAGAARQEFLLEDVRHEREQLEHTLAQVRNKVWAVEVEQNRTARVTLKSPARPPSEPNIDKRLKYAALALLLSGMLGVGAAFVRHRLDTNLYSPTQVVERLGVRVLGTVHQVPQANGTLTALEQGLREPVRGISTALLAVASPQTSHSRLITSPTPGSGKSSMAINLARSLAATGRRVLLVDGDNNHRGISRKLDLLKRPGLKELLEGTCAPQAALQELDPHRIAVIPAGESVGGFGELLANREAQMRLKGLFSLYDEVIVDSPPVLANSHALILATLVDEAVLVLRAGQSSRDEAEAAKEYLAAVGSRIVGAILNGVDPKNTRYGYGYGYGYSTTYQESST
ncbi:MAG: polysaccharide biosynthesis tyrosine autokinase [Planctomycetes bacterium]|nr:polysaccharide biosynthesis tyrosine autokinase [Planctomycetota bacterium]